MEESKVPSEAWILEDDAKAAAVIQEALKAVAPDLPSRISPSLKDLQKLLLPPEPPAVAPVVRFAIMKAELFASLAEASQTAEQIKKLKPSDAQELPIVITAFESSDKTLTTWSQPFVFNLIHQPFDLPLLKQHLRLALQHDKPSSESETHKMKTSSIIEVLKSVPMENLSEVGFTTSSDRQVPLGKVTKFYGKVFGWKNLISVFARSQEERIHPARKNEWQMLLTFFGTSREQLLQIRSRFPKKGDVPLEWRGKSTGKPVHFLILGDPSSAGSELSGTLERAFPGVKITAQAGLPEPKASLPPGLSAVFAHKNLLSSVEADPRLVGVPRIVMTTTVPTDEELRVYSAKAIDVVSLPTERMAFVKLISVLFPDLKTDDAASIHTYPWIEKIDVGQPVELVEMSEAGLVIHYERELPIGTIRRFVLWQPMEAGLPILTARCYLTQPDPSKAGAFIAYFVFFGMSDHEIKHVRLWMLDNYIQAKSKSG